MTVLYLVFSGSGSIRGQTGFSRRKVFCYPIVGREIVLAPLIAPVKYTGSQYIGFSGFVGGWQYSGICGGMTSISGLQCLSFTRWLTVL
ncbi:MAG: hypothetical protein EZS28_021255 [Streblomastix strix]|uniref:Uncharacterized protein n=1 Tax=Streblomastix strix TaxID=222440 RepID=A0A5J4VLJ2_9EUKA|nr:MAG: hypothetical protein EZS28_021255 [Streblomastix strix]